MKIIEQYIQAIGQKLPLKGRTDIKQELKSLLLDEIESKYGENPAGEEVNKAISEFGSPSKVAARYSGTRIPIGEGFSALYFMIIKILAFAMFVAFTVIFIIDLISHNLSGTALLFALGKIPLNVFSGWISGVGGVTLVFIIMTRVMKNGNLDPEEPWNPSQLSEITLEDGTESPLEAIISISFLVIMIIIVWFAPHLITLAEDSFLKSGIALENRVNIDVFRTWSLFLCFLWGGEIVYNGLVLHRGKTPPLKLYNLVLSLFSIIVICSMVFSKELYIINNGYIGFKLVFIIIGIVSVIEFAVDLFKQLRKYFSREG